MMANLKLAGPLNFMGNLTLKASSGKVTVRGAKVLVESSAPAGPHHGTAPAVPLPPPPAAPTDPGPNVWVLSSFNKTVKAGTKPIVALGMAMQGNIPSWPGMVLPSKGNSGPTAVTVNRVPVNVVNDQAVIFPTGAPANLNASSGQ
jgi:hypothetical protein